jgi:deazaflavin-dependent oxidoreductase (nitroreductase family)
MSPAVQVLVGAVLVVGVLALGFVWSLRTKQAVVLDRIRGFNRRVINPRQLRTAGSPGAYAAVVRHVGRASGRPYATPVVAVRDGEGFVIALPYGPGADWVRNVRAAGSAVLVHEGEVVPVDRPRVLDEAAAGHVFSAREQRSHRRFGVGDFLRLERAEDDVRHDRVVRTAGIGGNPEQGPARPVGEGRLPHGG